jgi:hypothetical protein
MLCLLDPAFIRYEILETEGTVICTRGQTELILFFEEPTTYSVIFFVDILPSKNLLLLKFFLVSVLLQLVHSFSLLFVLISFEILIPA